MSLLSPALFPGQLPSHSITPSSKHADSKPVPLTPAYHTLPHPSHHGTPHTTINWGPLEPPKTPKPWSLSCLRPAPPLRPSAALCYKEVSPDLTAGRVTSAVPCFSPVNSEVWTILCFCLWHKADKLLQNREGFASFSCYPCL